MSQNIASEWKLRKFRKDPTQYKVVKPIASGSFGDVFQIKNKKTKEISAAKIFKGNIINNREIMILANFQHPTIVKFQGFSLHDFYGNKNVTIFFEYYSKGSFEQLLQKQRSSFGDHDYDNTIRQKLMIGIARGMMYLHQHQIIHRDLKPDNILINDDFNPLITDFGLSKINELGSQMVHSINFCGTIIYMAPEIIDSSNYDYKVDVYSFGIIMYQIVTDLFPYPEINTGKNLTYKEINDFVSNIKKGLRPQFNYQIKESIKNLIEQCWDNDPNKRPSFEEIFYKLAYKTEDIDNNYFLDDVDENDINYYLDEIDKDDLNTENLLFKSAIEKLSQNQREKDAEILKQQSAIDQLSQKQKEKDAENLKLQSAIDQLFQKQKEKDAEILKLQSAIDQLSQKQKEKDAEILKLQSAIDQLSQKQEEKDAEILKLQSAIDQLSQKQEEKDAEILKLKNAIDQLSQKQEEKDAENLKLQSAIDQLSQKQEEKDAEILKLQSAIEKLSQNQKEKDAEILRLKKGIPQISREQKQKDEDRAMVESINLLLQKQKNIHFNIVVIGPILSGKTPLIHQFTKGNFTDNNFATPLPILYSKLYKKCNIDIWDTSGNEDCHSSFSLLHNLDAVLFVCSYDKGNSLIDFTNVWRKIINKYFSSIPIFLVINKSDLDSSEKELSDDDIEKLKSDPLFKDTFIVSAKNHEQVVNLFDSVIKKLLYLYIQKKKQRMKK